MISMVAVNTICRYLQDLADTLLAKAHDLIAKSELAAGNCLELGTRIIRAKVIMWRWPPTPANNGAASLWQQQLASNKLLRPDVFLSLYQAPMISCVCSCAP